MSYQLAISTGMSHLKPKRRAQIENFAPYVAEFPWFNIDVLHKLYLNIFQGRKLEHSQDQIKAFSLSDDKEINYEIRAITCADFLQSPQIIRIDYNVFKIEAETRAVYLDKIKAYPTIRKQIGLFLCAYAAEVRSHILSPRYREVYKIKGTMIIDPSKAASNIVKHVSNHIYRNQYATKKGKMIAYYLGFLDKEGVRGAYGDFIDYLKGMQHFESGEMDKAVKAFEKVKDAKKANGQSITVPLPISIQREIIKHFKQSNIEASKCICLIETRKSLLGNGFLIKGGYLLTTHNLIGSKEEAAEVKLLFNINTNEEITYELEPKSIFITNQLLGFTVVKIKDEDSHPIGNLGYLEMSDDKAKVNDTIWSFHHSSEKEISQRYGKISVITAENFQHDIVPIEGFSNEGLPILNTNGKIIGINKWDKVNNATWITNIKKAFLKSNINLGQEIGIETSLYLYINNIDGRKEDVKLLSQVGAWENIIITNQPKKADYFINIFNQLVYISNPNDQFRPLVKQIDLLREIDVLNMLEFQINRIYKWHRFLTLEDTSNYFQSPPIKVELRVDGFTEGWANVTDNEIFLKPKSEKSSTGRSQSFSIAVTNVSTETIFIGVFMLENTFGISSDVWDNQVAELQPSETKYFYDSNKELKVSIWLESYQEVYNWEKESLYFKFIFNKSKDFTRNVSNYLQPSLDKPFLHDTLRGGGVKEISREWNEKTTNWGTCTTTIHLKNSEFDKISGDLKDNWESYEKWDDLMPFIEMLYPSNHLNQFIEEKNKFSKKSTARGERTTSLGTSIGNFISKYRRDRKFKRTKSEMPDKPVIIAEGDSWFLYPFLITDTIDYLSEYFPVKSLASAGAGYSKIKKDNNLLTKVQELKPKYILLSIGGNDILGHPIKEFLVAQIPTASSSESYLNERFTQTINQHKRFFEYLAKELKKYSSVQQVFIHGYDYMRTDHSKEVIEKGFVNKSMIEKGIVQESDRQKIIKYIIDSFNHMIDQVSQEYDLVTHIDLRNVVQKEEWYDEAHPNNEGFQKISEVFLEAINDFEAQNQSFARV